MTRKYSTNPSLQTGLKIVRDTEGIILYKGGHDKFHRTSSRHLCARNDWRVCFQAFLQRRGSRYSDCLKDDTILGRSAQLTMETEPWDSCIVNRADEGCMWACT